MVSKAESYNGAFSGCDGVYNEGILMLYKDV